MLNGSQDGSDVGTGGPSLAILETGIPAGSFANNRVIEFLGDTYCVMANNASPSSGVYKKGQGGAGLWGRVRGGGIEWPGIDGHTSGLHVLHPNEVPTLVQMWFDSAADLQVSFTTDGTTGSEWGTNLNVVEASGAQPATVGQSIVFRNSVFWAHQFFTGTAGSGELTQYDLVTDTLTRHNIQAIFRAGTACEMGLHVHDSKLYAMNRGPAANSIRLARLDAGNAWVQVWQSGALSVGASGSQGHHAIFTDDATGDLIGFVSGTSQSQAWRFTDPAGSVIAAQISTTVMGATEGADKYLVGGGSASTDRRWAVYVDNDTAPTTPRTFLTTWIPGGGTETWEWKGVAAEMEAVAGLAGISDDFAMPYVTSGGGNRGTAGAPRAELGDVSNPAAATAAGTKWFFRVYGTGGPSVMTVYYNADEEAPDSIATLTGSVVVESGSPATTPTRSGNTIINLTADAGATLYSFVHDTGADGLGVGVPHTLMPNVV
jgi:hypothetical protein